MPGPALSVYSPLSRCGHPDTEFRHFEAALDVAPGVGDGLAVFARQQRGQRVHVAVEQFDEFHQHAAAALRVGRRPGGLGRQRILHRAPHFQSGRQRHARDHVAGHGLIGVDKAAGRPLDVFAADEMGQFGRHDFHPLFKVALVFVNRCRAFCGRAPGALQRSNSPIYCVKMCDGAKAIFSAILPTAPALGIRSARAGVAQW